MGRKRLAALPVSRGLIAVNEFVPWLSEKPQNKRRESNMKLTGWMNANIVGALSIGMLSSGAAAQDKPQEPTRDVHLVTASTPRERQIELARSAAPTEVSSKATVYILGPKGYPPHHDPRSVNQRHNTVLQEIYHEEAQKFSPNADDVEGGIGGKEQEESPHPQIDAVRAVKQDEAEGDHGQQAKQ